MAGRRGSNFALCTRRLAVDAHAADGNQPELDRLAQVTSHPAGGGEPSRELGRTAALLEDPRRRRPGRAALRSAPPSRRPPIHSGGDPTAPIGLPRPPQPSPSAARCRLPRRRRVGVRAPRGARRPSAAFAPPPLCSLRPGPCGPALAVPAHSPRASRGVWRDRAPEAQVDRQDGRRRPCAPLLRLRCGPSPTVPAACGAPYHPRRDPLRAGALRLAWLVTAHLRQCFGGLTYALWPRPRCAHPEAASRPARTARLAPGLSPGAA